jgi:hypothetical protein
MSRIIKFRAWHREAKKMLFGSPKEIFQMLEEGQPVDVIQWAGLTDMNKVDIYEGDIVMIAGYGKYLVLFPFDFLYEANNEDDIQNIIGNIYENPDLIQ